MVAGRTRYVCGIAAFSTAMAALFVAWQSRSSVVVSSSPVSCYRIESPDRPSTSVVFAPRSEVWCYRDLEWPKGARFIYQVDENGLTRPELAMIVEADGTITHASLLKGDLSVHRVRGFNPLNAPLTPPPDAEPVPAPISLAADTSVASAIEVFQEVEFPELPPYRVKEGEFEASAAKDSLPWSGYWFPYSSARLYAGPDSPLAKYDLFVQRRAGVNPGAQDWEMRRHYFTGVNWEGHCNGWAAASVLRKEPKRPITDPYSGITFTVSDLKGLWIERDYCPKIAFFGSRYWGAGNDPSDIYPHVFHNVLVHYIGELRKPVLIDIRPDPSVENRVASAYKMTIQKAGQQTYLVDTHLLIHEYDNHLEEKVGVAPGSYHHYRYYLMTDENDVVVGGYWLSYNPDFLWVPLAPGDCEDKNEALEEFWINEILKFDKPPRPTLRPSPRPSPSPGVAE